MIARAAVVAVALLLGACSALPPAGPNAELRWLDAELGRLRADPKVVAWARQELEAAERDVDRLIAHEDRLGREEFHHGLYVASRLVRVAQARAAERAAAQRRAELETEQAALVEQLRERDARRRNPATTAPLPLPSWTGSGPDYASASGSSADVATPLAESAD